MSAGGRCRGIVALQEFVEDGGFLQLALGLGIESFHFLQFARRESG